MNVNECRTQHMIGPAYQPPNQLDLNTIPPPHPGRAPTATTWGTWAASAPATAGTCASPSRRSLGVGERWRSARGVAAIRHGLIIQKEAAVNVGFLCFTMHLSKSMPHADSFSPAIFKQTGFTAVVDHLCFRVRQHLMCVISWAGDNGDNHRLSCCDLYLRDLARAAGWRDLCALQSKKDTDV